MKVRPVSIVNDDGVDEFLIVNLVVNDLPVLGDRTSRKVGSAKSLIVVDTSSLPSLRMTTVDVDSATSITTLMTPLVIKLLLTLVTKLPLLLLIIVFVITLPEMLRLTKVVVSLLEILATMMVVSLGRVRVGSCWKSPVASSHAVLRGQCECLSLLDANGFCEGGLLVGVFNEVLLVLLGVDFVWPILALELLSLVKLNDDSTLLALVLQI